ncbi:MAG TPA: hypothetical protein VF179_24815 [Thermoanaerobaculia bacterium]|nr:hypothetical protein [Thermoanaerobaculia bacterium]
MNGARFHLAWFKLNTDFFLSGRRTSEALQYALVPEELPESGAWRLDRIDLNGRPRGKFPAVPQYLCTLRRPEVAVGTEDFLENRLIEHLRGRAYNASHVLPGIVPTKRTPRWSKLVLPAEVLAELRRLGGAGV